MKKQIGDVRFYDFAYFIARPTIKPLSLEEWKCWRRFLAHVILKECADDPVMVIYGSSEIFPVGIPACQEFIVNGPSGKQFRVCEVSKMTEQIVQEEIIDAPQFELGDLLIWKPKDQTGQTQVQLVLEWRAAMFQQRVPYSHIIATSESIGFPVADGEWLYWANPKAPSNELRLIGQSHDVDIRFRQTDHP